jgi:hypothetical protein
MDETRQALLNAVGKFIKKDRCDYCIIDLWQQNRSEHPEWFTKKGKLKDKFMQASYEWMKSNRKEVTTFSLVVTDFYEDEEAISICPKHLRCLANLIEMT